MTSSPTSHRTRAGAFTLVEMMVAASVFSVVGLAVLGVLISTMQLSSLNVVANMSNYRARQTLDRVGEAIRYGQGAPTLLRADGTLSPPTDTSIVIKADGTTVPYPAGDGVLLKNVLGGPYIFKNSNGSATADIPPVAGSTSFMVEYNPATVAAPAIGDYFLLNLSTHPDLEVSDVGSVSVSGSVARVVVTTKAGLTETATPSTYAVSATRYRMEAYVFVLPPNSTQWELRRYPRVTAVAAGVSYTAAANYVTMGTGFQKLIFQPASPAQPISLAWFTMVADGGTKNVLLRALARSSDHGEYEEYFIGRNTLTAMPVQGKLWNYNP